MQTIQNQTSKGNPVDFWMGCLKERLGIMDANERRFALNLIKFYENHHKISDKQYNCIRKLVVRLICERDPLFKGRF